MVESQNSFKSFIFDLYLNPTLLMIAFYQIIATGAFTAQQILLAAYLDDLGYLESQSLASGLILAIYFVFWFILGPICGTLSDLHGRKFLIITANIISSFGFIGLVLFQDPLLLFIVNGILGIGAALRIGSVIALWIQHSPKNRIGESMAYINIILGIGGIGATVVGFILWTEIKEISFFVFGAFLLFAALLILPISDDGDYIPFSIRGTIDMVRAKFSSKFMDNFFLTPPIIKLGIHWLALSAIVSFGTFLIPIIDRIVEELPSEVNLPVIPLLIIGIGTVVAAFTGLLFWGRISDKWARRPVLVIGFTSTAVLILNIYLIFQFNQIPRIIEGLNSRDILVIGFILLLLVLLFTMTSLIPAPMAWIVDIMGKENLGKAMSLRQALIAIGTIIGTSIGGFVIGTFGISGLILVILLFLVISAVIII
ncbi:MAG: MFS transporter [Candidatus Hodarchaeales archaeon]|jgi:MFS family permease